MARPLQLVRNYFEKNLNQLGHAHVCFTTLDAHGYPNSRFVDLKQVTETALIFGTSLNGTKSEEIDAHNKVNLCLWWREIGVQIRVAGEAKLADIETSNALFAQRSKDAQAISSVAQQSAPMKDVAGLKSEIEDFITRHDHTEIARPASWGAYEVYPVTIEIMLFAQSRFHQRTRYVKQGASWSQTDLQP